MSWTDEEIDKLVQDATASQQPVYKDAYWEEMNALLNSKSTKKGMFWWTSLAVVLLLTSAGIAVYSANKFPGNSELIAGNETSESQRGESTNALLTSISEEKELENQITKELESSSNTLNSIKSNKLKVPANAVGSYAKSSGSNLKNPESTKSLNAGVESGRKGNAENNLNNPKSVSLKNMSISQPVETPSNLKSISNGDKNLQTQVGSSNQESILVATKNTDRTAYPTEVMMINGLPTRAWNNATVYGLEAQMADLPIFPRTHLGFYAEAKGGIGQSYVRTGKNNELYQVGFSAGLEYFKQNWILSAGLGIRQQFAQNLDFQKYTNMYSFGSVRSNQQLNYDQLVFFDLPISATYQFNKSSLGILFTPTYLAGTRLSYSVNTEETVGDFVTTQVLNSRSKSFVSSDNFRSLGCNLGLTYGYSLANNFMVSATVSSRISGNLVRTEFIDTRYQLPVMVELGLKKRF